MWWTVSVVFLVAICNAAKLPDGIEYCRRADPKLNECLQKSIKNGLKLFVNGNREFNIQKLEPFHVNKIEIDGARTGSVSLDQKYTDVDIYNTSEIEIPKIKVDLDQMEWSMDILNKLVVMKADYVLNGQILVFPINGKGKCTVTLKDMVATHTLKMEKYKKNGKEYIKVIDWKANLKPEYVHYNFENIIPGNEQVSNEVLKTVNENAVSIFNDIKGGFEQVFSTLYMSGFNNVFAKIPINELFLE